MYGKSNLRMENKRLDCLETDFFYIYAKESTVQEYIASYVYSIFKYICVLIYKQQFRSHN